MSEKEWRDLTDEEKKTKLDSLVSLADICTRLGLNSTEVFWLMSVKKLPGWLVGGVWKFDQPKIDEWTAANGGVEEVQRFIRAAIEKHREAARAVPADPRAGGAVSG